MEELQQAAGEFFQERWAQLVVAFIFAGVGAYITALRNRRKTAKRIAVELIATHTAMLDRAFPHNGWRESDPREEWMLEPYVRRVDFLDQLAQDNGLSADAIDAVGSYGRALAAFIATWATSRRRSPSFQDALNELTQSLEDALKALRRLRRYRNNSVWKAGDRASNRQAQVEQRAALEAGTQVDPRSASSVIQGGPTTHSGDADQLQQGAGEDAGAMAPPRS